MYTLCKQLLYSPVEMLKTVHTVSLSEDELQKAKTVIMPVNVGNSTTGHFGAFLRGKSLRKGTWCVEDVGRQTQKDTSSCGVFICKGVNRVQC
ncbi:PREDICTED: uncharacterized protein LOC106819278 isoform X2 [Priapulus caudatus]|uniref:Uncharacterized protein LOC106819278 isoform X2 n=1 Tax=Priapulus caudatus TaxID=37621 RepID=A0ABM1F4P0_PRICU|nr:PREDICTED: uncharacterized protein LOC106819278 isoform X2 [Priapulus caudatus]